MIWIFEHLCVAQLAGVVCLAELEHRLWCLFISYSWSRLLVVRTKCFVAGKKKYIKFLWCGVWQEYYHNMNISTLVRRATSCYCFFGWAWKQIMALSLLFLRQASSLDAAFGCHLLWLRAVRGILTVLPFNSTLFSSSYSAGLEHNQHLTMWVVSLHAWWSFLICSQLSKQT